MSKLTVLSNSLFAFSLISFVIFSLLPEKSAGKKLLRTVAGLISVLIIISSLSLKFDTEDFHIQYDDSKYDTKLSEYISEKEAEAFAADLKSISEPILTEYGIDNVRISVFTDKSDGQGISINKAVFYIQKDIDYGLLEKRLTEESGVNCEVVREDDR